MDLLRFINEMRESLTDRYKKERNAYIKKFLEEMLDFISDQIFELEMMLHTNDLD